MPHVIDKLSTPRVSSASIEDADVKEDSDADDATSAGAVKKLVEDLRESLEEATELIEPFDWASVW